MSFVLFVVLTLGITALITWAVWYLPIEKSLLILALIIAVVVVLHWAGLVY